jgi:hypothetical protein
MGKLYIMDINIKIVDYDNYYKIIANKDINKGTIVLTEKPLIQFDSYDPIIIIYHMLKNKNKYIENLYPRDHIELINPKNEFNIDLLKLLNKSNINIKKYLQNILQKNSINLLYQYYYKYLFNAFSINNKPSILILGAMMNHSCKPNIVFYEKNNSMYFEVLDNIKKGDELCYSYLRNYKYKTNKDKYLYLLNHYNFECKCILCI